ncbi:visgun [Glossina fuscipes fuscipes]|nr:hypothetical protein GQX74_012940 [Glossina fuscipes]
MKSVPLLNSLLVLCLFLGLCFVPFNCEGTEAVNKNDLTSKVNGATLATNKDNTDVVLENPTPDKTVTTQSSNNGSSSGFQTTLSETATIPLTTTTPSNNSTVTTSSMPNRTTSTTSTTTVAPTASTTNTTTTTIAPTTSTTAPLTTTTVVPNPEPCHRFDGPSFIGGIVLTLGLLAIGVVAYKFYKARNERNYQTL